MGAVFLCHCEEEVRRRSSPKVQKQCNLNFYIYLGAHFHLPLPLFFSSFLVKKRAPFQLGRRCDFVWKSGLKRKIVHGLVSGV